MTLIGSGRNFCQPPLPPSAVSLFPLSSPPVAYLSEDEAVPEAFVTNLRAGVSNCDSVAPINWDRACDDLEDGFPVDCSGMRYVEQEEEAPSQEEEGVETQKRPPAKGAGMGGGRRHTS